MTTYVTTSPGQKVQADLARSWLLVNAVQTERFVAAENSAADVLLYDIEDAVAPKDKERALKNVANWFADGHTGWVRINGYGSPWWEQDVTELAKYISHELEGPHHNGGLQGVMLAMVESTDHVNETAARLPGVPIVALVETARGLQRINSIDRKSTRLNSSHVAISYAVFCLKKKKHMI